MNRKREQGDGICILSLDSGGPGAYSQLLIIKEYMSRRANDLEDCEEEDLYPADFFDLMGGVGFGGLVAIMLGLLRMKVDDAIEALLAIASTVFPEGPQAIVDKGRNAKILKRAIVHLLEERRFSPDSKMNEQNRASGGCKVVIYAAASANLHHPNAFRTYSSRGSSLNPTIVEAACATMAVPSHFEPVKMGPSMRQQCFVGGALGANNPTRLLLTEASSTFGKDQRVAQIISLGSGSAKNVSLDTVSKEAGVTRLLNEMVADCEMVAQELSTRLFNIDVYLRLKVEKGMDNICIDNWLELGDIEAHTKVYFEDPAVGEALDSSLRRLQEKVGTTTLGQIMFSSSIKVTAKKAPAVSPHFVLRKEPWEAMLYQLIKSPSSRQKIFPITGMGGCGKTQLASYFLQEHSNLYNHIVYVDASSSSSIKADLQTWARALEGDHGRDVWEDALSALNGAPQGEKWILIFDNADDPTLNLVPFLPVKDNVAIILTSRNRDLGNLSTTQHLELGEMNTEEAQHTLLRAARRQAPIPPAEMESANTLLKELGCLAVALVQAGTYCHTMSSNTNGVFRPYTFTHYLSLFYSHRAELMKRALPASLDSYGRGAYTTLDLSYKALPQTSGEFLHFVSFFHHAAIPLEALASAARNAFKDPVTYLPRSEVHSSTVSELGKLLCTNGEWNELKVQGFISTLCSFSLLTASTIDDFIFLHLHPLIQTWARDMESPASQHCREMAIQVLIARRVDENVRLNQYLLPHALDILDHIQTDDLHVNELAAIGALLNQQGLYRKAPRLLEAALKTMKKSPESGSLKTLTIVSNLGRAYRKEGKRDKAEELALEVLEQRKRVLGGDALGTLRAMEHLASTYDSQGRYSEAEEILVKVLAQRKRLLGPDSHETMNAAANLAGIYFSQKRWIMAQELHEKVLEYRRRTLGQESPGTIKAAGNLASTYDAMGRWSDAEKLELEVLEYRKRVLGLEHPTTIRAAANLALTYGKQGRLEEDLALRAPTVQLAIKVLGLHHHHTQLWIKHLANLYVKLEKWAEYEEMSTLLLPQEDHAGESGTRSRRQQDSGWETITQPQSQQDLTRETQALSLPQLQNIPPPSSQPRSQRLLNSISRLRLRYGKAGDTED